MWLAVGLVITVGVIIIMAFRMVAMQPYEVTEGGVCAFEVQPTGLNGGEELPCGSLRTHFSILEEIYYRR